MTCNSVTAGRFNQFFYAVRHQNIEREMQKVIFNFIVYFGSSYNMKVARHTSFYLVIYKNGGLTQYIMQHVLIFIYVHMHHLPDIFFFGKNKGGFNHGYLILWKVKFN